MTSREHKTAYVMVNLPSRQQGQTYLVSSIPFTEAKLEPGEQVKVDKLYTSYETLKEGLVREFGIKPEEVPDADYFDPTPEEEAYDEDPVLRVVPVEPEEMSWESDARRAVRQALENADWDFEEKTVTIYDRDDTRKHQTFESLEELQNELEMLAEVGSQNSMPWEGGPVFPIDAEGIVLEELEEYRENLNSLGWEF